MITQAQIDAEEFGTALTDKQVLVLILLVRRYPAYYNYPGRYPSLEDKLAAEESVPTVLTAALKAVLTQLGAIPAIVVESSGDANAQSFFSTKDNWVELAQDVLDIMYKIPMIVGSQSFAIAQRDILGMVIKDRAVHSRLLKRRSVDSERRW